MKTLIVAALAATLAISSSLLAQEKAQISSTAVASAVKPLIVSGKVSSDGKMLLTDLDSEWTISNAEMMKGHEGRLVTVKCYVNTEKSQLQVLSIKRDRSETSYVSRQTDSAFRR